MTASSTSQSTRSVSARGSRIGTPSATTLVGNLANTSGTSGGAWPDSRMWSW